MEIIDGIPLGTAPTTLEVSATANRAATSEVNFHCRSGSDVEPILTEVNESPRLQIGVRRAVNQPTKRRYLDASWSLTSTVSERLAARADNYPIEGRSEGSWAPKVNSENTLSVEKHEERRRRVPRCLAASKRSAEPRQGQSLYFKIGIEGMVLGH